MVIANSEWTASTCGRLRTQTPGNHSRRDRPRIFRSRPRSIVARDALRARWCMRSYERLVLLPGRLAVEGTARAARSLDRLQKSGRLPDEMRSFSRATRPDATAIARSSSRDRALQAGRGSRVSRTCRGHGGCVFCRRRGGLCLDRARRIRPRAARSGCDGKNRHRHRPRGRPRDGAACTSGYSSFPQRHVDGRALVDLLAKTPRSRR